MAPYIFGLEPTLTMMSTPIDIIRNVASRDLQAYDEPPRGSLQKMPLEILDNIFSHLLVLDDKHNHVFDFTGELKRQPEVINLALLSVNRRLSEAAKSYFIANNDLVIVDYDYGFFKQCMRAGGQRYLARVKRHMPRAHQMMEIEWTAKCPGENAKGQRGSIILRFADFGRLTKLLQLEYFRRRGKMLYCDWNESEEPTYIQRIHNCPWTLIVKFRTSKFHRRDFSMPQYCALARKLLQPLAAMNGSDHIIKTFGAGDNADVCLELLIARNNHPVADVTAMGWCLAEIAVFWRSEIQKICLPTDKNAVHLQQLFRSMHYFTHFLINNGLFDFGEPFAGDMAGVVEPPVTSPEFVESYRQVVLVAYIDSVAIGLKALCIESPHNCHQNPAFAVWVNTLCVIPSGRRDVPVETLANAYWGLATAASEAEHAIELLQAALRLVPDHGWMMADFLARVTAQRGSGSTGRTNAEIKSWLWCDSGLQIPRVGSARTGWRNAALMDREVEQWHLDYADMHYVEEDPLVSSHPLHWADGQNFVGFRAKY